MLDLDLLKSVRSEATTGEYKAKSWGIATDDQFYILVNEDDDDECQEIATVWQGQRWLGMKKMSAEQAEKNLLSLVYCHNAMPELISWIERAIPILQATETLAQVYCRFVCKDKNCKYCDYIQKDVPEANALLKEVSK